MTIRSHPQPLRNPFQCHSALGRVALLGIAQRRIRIKYAHKSRKQQQSKPWPASIKTLGDWIQVKRMEKKLTPGHLALKMGIATALVRSWEDSTAEPDNRQLEVLASLLGFDAGDRKSWNGSTGFSASVSAPTTF